ncbi:MAG TPA: glycoside hydrolase family 16 protein [Prolixibacteraceae bacterium]|nr:glycoside hydrolase family 16 protein [Prolixibacteraceae bacterium]
MKKFLRMIVAGILLFVCFSKESSAQTYSLVWEDTFDGDRLDPRKWNVEDQIGIWNTGGNNEFQHYRKENIRVGDDGNGNNCLIITAKKEAYKGYSFTSGRVNTKGKFAFKRGKLEASIRIPDLANGLWPAFWALGYTPNGWPDCGEIDVLEMGHAAGIASGTVNRYIGSHLFWGPYPSDYGKSYTAGSDLTNGYFKHTVVWDESRIAVFFNDSSQPYFTMGITGDNTEEFRDYPFYILFNLAVGGSVPGITQTGDITVPLPASMYIDWVRVYQETGKEDFATTRLPLYGSYGVFEENAATDMHLTRDFDLQVETSGVSTNTSEVPFAGDDVLSYNTEATQAFYIGLKPVLPRNMENYANGSIQFYLKTNSEGPITVGLADTLGSKAGIILSDESGRNFPRDNNWHLLSLPVSGFSPAIDLTSIGTLLYIEGTTAEPATLSIDEVVYTETVPAAGLYGIYTENPAITERLAIDNVTGHLYNWDNTVAFNQSISPYEGSEALSFRSQGGAGWWGWGIFSDQALNLENFSDGYLHFALNTKSAELFRVTVNGANNTKGEVTFQNGNDPYGFLRDGRWHRVVVPVADLRAKGLDLSSCGNVFTLSGGSISGLAVDDVYFSESPDPVDNNGVNAIGPPILLPDYLRMNYSKKTKNLEMSGFTGSEQVSVYNARGQCIHFSQPKESTLYLDLTQEQSPFCLIQVLSPEGMWIRKILVY